ncbi:hypothetical protein B0H34DRAFT_674442 [Crassisporium funariophilum]|nr:hypothetical protein B0H34DRAFT_674442 [Crassisporium funariophilum]
MPLKRGYASSAHRQAVNCQGARARRRRQAAEPISRPTNGVKHPGRCTSALPTQAALSLGLPPPPYLPCHIKRCWASVAGHCRGSRYQTCSNGKLWIADSDNKSLPTPSSAAPYNLFKQGEQAKIAGHRQLKGNMAPDPLAEGARHNSRHSRQRPDLTTYAHAPFPPHPLPLLLCYITGLAPMTRQKQSRTPRLPHVTAPPCLQCVRGLSRTKNPTGWFLLPVDALQLLWESSGKFELEALSSEQGLGGFASLKSLESLETPKAA